MKKNLQSLIIMIALVIMNFGQTFAQKVSPLEGITFEDGTIAYVWDSWGNIGDVDPFTVIDNPDKTGVNQSDKVGQYICHEGANSWAGMNIHDSVEITISEDNQFFTMDVLKTGLSKTVMILEQASGTVQRFDSYPFNTKTDEWETLVFDFSSVIGHTFYRLSIQPDLTEVDPRTDSSVVYLDNIKWHRDNPQVANPLRPITFEPEGNGYNWVAFDNTSANNDVNSFTIENNPDPTGVNSSAKVGKYITHDGAAMWAGFKTNDLEPIVITDNNKWLSMDVYKTSTNNVGLKYEGGTDGNQKDVFVTPVKTGEWETLVFDFSAVVGDTFPTFVIFPDWGATNPRVGEAITYIDNIKWHRDNPQVANPLRPITFEPEGNGYNWVAFDNTSANNDVNSFTIENNPDPTGVNSSAKVGKYITHDGAAMWAGFKTNDLEPIVITDNNKWLSMDVYKTSTNNVGLKYEGGTDGNQKDVFVTPVKTGEWETLVFDFSAVVGDTFPTFVIFPDWGATNPRVGEAITYIDNIVWHRDNPQVANPLRPITFEPEGNGYNWVAFDNTSANNDVNSFTIENNPDPTGVNSSAKVGKYITHDGAAMWAGFKTNDLESIVITDNNKWLSMDVYKTSTNNVGLKYEGGTDGNQKDVFVTPVKTGEWETLVFDFSAVVGDTFPTFVIFPDWGATNPRVGEAITYIDNIMWHNENPLSINYKPGIANINIYPNPANTILNITGINDATSIVIFNISGEMVKAMNVNRQDAFSVPVDMLNEGVYFVRVISNKGLNTFKFIKQ